MSLIEIFQRFPDHAACIAHLEVIRWRDTPACPHCGSVRVARKADGHRVGRWNCHDCHGSFNVLHGTIFQKTKIPLQKWFLAIGLLLNAKKSISSCQLARDLELNQKSAWFLAMRVRMEMAKDSNAGLLQGIVEADECYVGGKPRKANRREDNKPGGQGWTDKMPVIGVVERGGRVVARRPRSPRSARTGSSGSSWTTWTRPARCSCTTRWQPTTASAWVMRHATINHSVSYADGDTQHEHHRGILERHQARVVRLAPPLQPQVRRSLRSRAVRQLQRPEHR